MKCYFALSDDVSNNDIYYYLFYCTLNSARKNTNLELHCLYDFRQKNCNNIEDDRIFNLLKKFKVIIHLKTIDFENSLFNIYTDDYLKSIGVTKTSLYSRFLRFMIADIEKEDEYILYADTDLIFMKDISLESFNIDKGLPKTVAVCPEFENTMTYSNFNAGVMLINTKSYKECKSELINLLQNKQKAKIECCDQGYLNLIYENNFTKMNNIWNWKPYWGINDNAVIVHLHGLKPRIDFSDIECRYIPFVSELLYKNKNAKEGWFYYFNLFAQYAELDPKIVLTNLSVTMQNQNPEKFAKQNNIFRKIYRKIKHILGR